MNVQLKAIGEALPGRDIAGMEVSNACLAQAVANFRDQQNLDFPLPEESFPRDRVGVLSRRFLDSSLSTLDMARVAAREAVRVAALDPSLYRVVVVSSVTIPTAVPALAALLQSELGFDHDVAAVDSPLGCNGYLGGLRLCQALLADCPSGSAALLVTSEAMSRVLDATDRQTSVIFGDGAAASVLQRGEGPGIGRVAWFTQGEKGPLIQIAPGPGPTYRFWVEGDKLGLHADPHSSLRVSMTGRQVFRDMVTDLPRRIRTELELRGQSLSDFQHFAFHQANQRIVHAVADNLGIPHDLLLTNIDQLGNTTSASIPLMLSEADRSGRLQTSDRVLLIGFGTGYSVGIGDITWTR